MLVCRAFHCRNAPYWIQAARCARRWPGTGVGLWPWEAPADACRACAMQVGAYEEDRQG